MTAFENAQKFFNACEAGKGWAGCKSLVADGAGFEAQSEPLADVKTVEAYCEWMAGLASGPLKGCSYTVHSSSYDDRSNTAVFVATFHAAHNGEGGPVSPTHKNTNTDYVYALTMDGAGKVNRMRKVWNASWALRELGWM